MYRLMTSWEIKVAVILVFFLFSISRDALAEQMTFDLQPGLNGISLPFEGTGITNAEELVQSIFGGVAVSSWDAPSQTFVTHEKGSAEDNFPVLAGYPYFIRVSEATSWTVRGELPARITFFLITTEGTDINTIALPLYMGAIRTAEQLANAIPHCDTVWTWDAVAQGYVGHPRGTPINDFAVQPGRPYFVNITEDTLWIPDDVPPVIAITSPTDGSSIDTATPQITVAFSDEGSGIDPASFRAKINGVDSTDRFTVTETGATYQVTDDLPDGENTVTASISDRSGNGATAVSTFTVVILQVSLNADPTRGQIPLEVQFSAMVSGGTPPYRYSWDLDGDGTGDDTRASFAYVYLKYGVSDVTLIVTDAKGNTATATVRIYALAAPTVITTAVPNEGEAPLDVSFGATVSDPDGSVVLYEWDFDGDGGYDHSDPETAKTTHTYTAPGLYAASIRVTDNDGLTGTDTITITVGNPPVASADAVPTTGTAPLEVAFRGTGTDADGTVALYEWDFDGDGVYDWSDSTTGNTSFSYTTSGVFNATLRVTDGDGLIDTDSLLISVSGPPVARPRAYPTHGNAPLTVTFFSDGDDPDGSPRYFDWDFDGDGAYDVHLLASMNTSHTYNKGGVYDATLKVTDNDGLSGTASIVITVTEPNPQGYPTAVAAADPTNGGAPLDVALMGDGADPGGKVAKYEWDFNGDEVYDWEESAEPGGPLGLVINVGVYSAPVFADLDADGDLDLFVGEYYGGLFFYRNDGTSRSPLWIDAGLLRDVNGKPVSGGDYNNKPAFSDIDADGDLDLFIGGFYGKIYFYRNDGTSDAAVWTPVGFLTGSDGVIISAGRNSSPVFTDLDGDGDPDLLVGGLDGEIRLYQNEGDRGTPVWSYAGSLTDADGNPIDSGSRSSPVFLDADDDGDPDLFIGGAEGTVLYYRNDGNGHSPSWVFVGSLTDADGKVVDVGSFGTPGFADIDGDGDFDLFLGNFSGAIHFYRNDGSETLPLWSLVSQRYDYLGVERFSSPALVDIDHDGDLDLFVGESAGRIYFYRNDGTTGSPLWTSVSFLTDSAGNTLGADSSSSPAFVDIDADGDFDLFIGRYDGKISRYRNDGTSDSPLWTPEGFASDSEGNTIDVGYSAAPAFADIDGDGDADLFVGELEGRIYFYRNDGTTGSPVWARGGTLTDVSGQAIDVGSNSSPTFYDTDRDGDFDLFVGEYHGQTHYYRNDGDRQSWAWNLVTANYVGTSLGNRSTPAVADIDGDGDPDLFLGNGYGTVYLYPTSGHVIHRYEAPGTFQATLRVTDDEGLTATSAVTIRVYDPGVPTAVASASSTSGEVPFAVSFRGRGTDPDGTIVLYAWDFDGDGVYDWSSPNTGETAFTYRQAGNFTAVFRVTDNEGKTATDSVTVNASVAITTSRTGYFDPSTGQSGTLSSTLSADATITIKIVDENGNVVRTLIDGVSRTAGSYKDVWDGRDDLGNLVADGLYYFVVTYTLDGQTYTYDLRETAGFKQYSPSRSWSPTFNPYEDDFLEISYTLARPAEVSLYFWTRGPGSGQQSIVNVRTLFVRELRGAGSHTEIWDGVDDKGAVVDPGKVYPATLKVFELPDNAIIVGGDRPTITDVSADPNYFSSGYNPYGSASTPYTIVSFSLSEPARVEARIANSDGLIVKTVNQPGLPAGANTLVWDGRDVNGGLVREGSYTVALTAIDANGNRSLPRYAAVFVYY